MLLGGRPTTSRVCHRLTQGLLSQLVGVFRTDRRSADRASFQAPTTLQNLVGQFSPRRRHGMSTRDICMMGSPSPSRGAISSADASVRLARPTLAPRSPVPPPRNRRRPGSRRAWQPMRSVAATNSPSPPSTRRSSTARPARCSARTSPSRPPTPREAEASTRGPNSRPASATWPPASWVTRRATPSTPRRDHPHLTYQAASPPGHRDHSCDHLRPSVRPRLFRLACKEDTPCC